MISRYDIGRGSLYPTPLGDMIEILTQTMHNKLRQAYQKIVFATNDSIMKLCELLLSRFRLMCLNEYEFSQFYEALRCYAVSDKSIIMTNMTPYRDILNGR